MFRVSYIKVFYGIVLLSLLTACGMKRKERKIDFEKSVKLGELLKSLSIQEISVLQYGGALKINDQIVVSDSINLDALELCKIHECLHETQWVELSIMTKSDLVAIKELLKESNNVKVISDQGAFFFMTGSWIDAQWGKVYSTSDIIGKEGVFEFEGVKEITPIEDFSNWFEYYAD